MLSQEQIQEALTLYKSINKYGSDNQIEITQVESGNVSLRMQVLEKHLSSPDACHGGAIAGLMDSVMGTAALTVAFVEAKIVSTIEFKINYFKPAFLGDVLEATAIVDFHGKSTIVCSGYIHNANKELIAKAMGTFNKYDFTKRNFSRV